MENPLSIESLLNRLVPSATTTIQPAIPPLRYNVLLKKPEEPGSHAWPLDRPTPYAQIDNSGYGKGREAQIMQPLTAGFSYRLSPCTALIHQHFGEIPLRALLPILHKIISHCNLLRPNTLPELTRTEKRSLPLVLAYIDRHYNIVAHELQYAQIVE
jgi:hypothetical protein